MSEQNNNRHDVVLGFIVGMSRGGTTWAGRSLDNHPEIAVIGETLYWGRQYEEPDESGLYSPKQQKGIINRLEKRGLTATCSTAGSADVARQKKIDRRMAVGNVLAGTEEALTPEDLFSTICEAVAAAEGKRFVIEKTPHHIMWADRLISVYPDARLIIMYREPYSFMLSYKHQADRRSDRNLQARTRGMYHPLGCAWVWRGYARAVADTLARYPSQSLRVEYGEIREDSALLLDKMQKFLGVEVYKELSEENRFSSFKGEERPELEPADIFWMNFIARKEIKQFGIATTNAGFEMIPVLISIITLPLWFARVMGRYMGGGWSASAGYFFSWVRRRK